MWAHRNHTNKLFYQVMFVSLMGVVLLACNKKEDTSLRQHYSLGESSVELRLQKTQYHLPDYINFSLNIESNEELTPKVSIDKQYKKHLQLAHFNKNTVIVSRADRLLHQYQFIFSAKQADTIWFSGFNVQFNNGAEVKTDSIQICVNSVLNDKNAEPKPIITKLPFRFPFGFIIGIILLSAGGFYIYKRRLQTKVETPIIERDEKTYLLKEIESLRLKPISPMKFDSHLQKLLFSFKAHLQPTEYIKLINEYDSYYKEQSFAQNQAESERRNKLISYLVDKLNN